MGIVGSSEKTLLFRFVFVLYLCSRHRHHKDYGFVEKPHNERRNRHFLSLIACGKSLEILWQSIRDSTALFFIHRLYGKPS